MPNPAGVCVCVWKRIKFKTTHYCVFPSTNNNKKKEEEEKKRNEKRREEERREEERRKIADTQK